jgi:hypothetical protein
LYKTIKYSDFVSLTSSENLCFQIQALEQFRKVSVHPILSEFQEHAKNNTILHKQFTSSLKIDIFLAFIVPVCL